MILPLDKHHDMCYTIVVRENATEAKMKTRDEMLNEFAAYTNAWAQFGAAHFIAKIGGRWYALDYEGEKMPVSFDTKKAAEFVVDAKAVEAGLRKSMMTIASEKAGG